MLRLTREVYIENGLSASSTSAQQRLGSKAVQLGLVELARLQYITPVLAQEHCRLCVILIRMPDVNQTINGW